MSNKTKTVPSKLILDCVERFHTIEEGFHYVMPNSEYINSNVPPAWSCRADDEFISKYNITKITDNRNVIYGGGGIVGDVIVYFRTHQDKIRFMMAET